MVAYTQDEIARREDALTTVLDLKNLADLRERKPEVVNKILALLEVGHTPDMIGRVIRVGNPQMWVESKFAESVARGLIDEGNDLPPIHPPHWNDQPPIPVGWEYCGICGDYHLPADTCPNEVKCGVCAETFLKNEKPDGCPNCGDDSER